jgi:hypothetical protein
MDDKLQLLLTEFRAFRDTEFREFREDVAAWKQAIGERVATTETQVKDLYGNGRAGRVTAVEKKLAYHSKIIWIGTGVLFAIQVGLAVAKLWGTWMH